MRSVWMILTAICISFCTQAKKNNASKIEAIQGRSDFVRVSEDKQWGISFKKNELDERIFFPERYKTLIDAIGKMSPEGCTGTHIGHGWVLTAGHCLIIDQRASSQLVAAKNQCAKTTIAWGYRGSFEDAAGSFDFMGRCVEVAFAAKEQGLDYALFRVDSFPRAHIPLALDTESEVPFAVMPLQSVTIFSHPKGRPLEWSKTCPVASVTTQQLTYACDTEAGSSGAVVINDARLQIVGIHNWGKSRKNGGTLLSAIPHQPLLQEIAQSTSRHFGEPMIQAAILNPDGAGRGFKKTWDILPHQFNGSLIVIKPKTAGGPIQFTLAYDLEDHPFCGFDHVWVLTASSASKAICGKGELRIEASNGPVTLFYKSDWGIRSKKVVIKDVAFSSRPTEAEGLQRLQLH